MRQLSDVICDQHPLIMPETATVQSACEKMRERRVGSVLVTDPKGVLAGIFTGRDAVCKVLAHGKSAARTQLKQAMTASPVTMSPRNKAIDALRLMWDGGFRHVPLVEEGKIVGVVSRGDFKGAEHGRLEEEREIWEHMR